ncbi:MAG: SMP-30/gluconolactonase/LRE family protein [Pseudomonadota bacterium]
MIDLASVDFVGSDLRRPECVLSMPNGDLHIADWRGGITVIHPDGPQRTVLADGAFKPKPNGFALHPDGGWLLAHLGDADGGVYWLKPDGALSPFLLEIDNAPLPPTNYIHVDANHRFWITVSTRVQPRGDDYRPDASSGFAVLVDEAGARIVADDLGYANECLIHPEDGMLYINETFTRKTSRYPVGADGTLGPKEIVAEYGAGTFPDGLTFDAEGGFWITSIVSNRVIRVLPDGRQHTMLEDCDPAFMDWVEEAFQDKSMGRPHLDNNKGKVLRNISSLAFGGMDLKDCYLGCLLGDRIGRFRSPVAGLPPSHWSFA